MSTDDRPVLQTRKTNKRPRVSDGHSGPNRNIRRIEPPTNTIHTRSNDTNLNDSDVGATDDTHPVAPVTTQNDLPRATTPPSRYFENLSITEHTASVQRTPVRTNSSSRIHTPPTQFQNSNSNQRVLPTLTDKAAHASEERAKALILGTITKSDMESILQQEINGAIRMSNNFCETCLAIPQSAHLDHIKEQLQRIVDSWLPIFQKWSAQNNLNKGEITQSDASDKKLSESEMYKPLAKLLNSIAEVAFVPNHFRPCSRDVVDYHTQTVASDDRDDTDGRPDLVQGVLSKSGIIHWNDVEFIVECKPQLGLLHSAVMQLCRYARSTFIHQLHRNHVYLLAICGTQATFVRFDRSEILHSSSIELSTSEGLYKFVEAVAGLFALSAEDFGYDTHFSFFPKPKGTSGDRLKHRQWRYTQDSNGQQWRIMEIICQRKCLIGRATAVLRLSKIGAPRTRRVIKIIWKPISRPHEGDNLRMFQGNRGICQCEWMHTDVSTALPEGLCLEDSAIQKFFFPDVKPGVFAKAMSLTTGNVSTSHSTSMNHIKAGLRHKQVRPHPPETRVKCVVIMGEGTSLWRITRLLHLLIVLRDALVGFAHIVEKGKIHRDISEGNILCDILDDQLEKSDIGDDDELSSDESGELEDGSDDEEDKIDEENESSSDKDYVEKSRTRRKSLAPIRTDDSSDAHQKNNKAIDVYGFLDTYEFPKEEELTNVSSLEDYVARRYRNQKDIGKIYDLEFMVDEVRLDVPPKGRERTGTPAFISGQLLLPSESVQHRYIHDLESFLWVFFWLVITRKLDIQDSPDDIAFDFVTCLCNPHDRSLGEFKRGFISFSGDRNKIKAIENGWDMEVVHHIVQEFAHVLQEQIYIKDLLLRSTLRLQVAGAEPFAEGSPSSWEIIYSVISVLDQQIIVLQERERVTLTASI